MDMNSVMDSPRKKRLNDKAMNSPRKRKLNEETMTAKSLDYFTALPDDGVNKMFKCHVCNSPINGNKLHNLSLHLRTHKAIYKEISGQNHDISFKQLELLQNIVEMVSVNGRPFSCIFDSGFQSIIRDDVLQLNAAGLSLHLMDANLPEVKKHLNVMADGIREKIKQEVHGRALSLMMDIGTKNRRSIFGISVQYIINGKLRIRSIGMKELLKSHTAKYLAEVVQERLKVYGIDLKQILTITTDNGANVLKMVRDIDKILQSEMDSPTPQQAPQQPPQESQKSHCSSNAENQMDVEIEELLFNLSENSEDAALDELFDNVQLNEHETLLTAMKKQIIEEFGLNVLYDITGVNCSAHNLQLAIKNALKKLKRKHGNVIALCRHVAKLLRLKSYQEMYKTETADGCYKTPRMDVETRWGYTCLMIYDVINCKKAIDFFADVKKIKDFQLLKKKWDILIEIGHILSVPYMATIEFQKQNLTLSDVFGSWLKMKLHLSAIIEAKKNYETGLAKYLLEALEERKDIIFSNPFMSAALFLDPRYRSQIVSDEEKVERAKATLENIWRRSIVLKSPVSANVPMNISSAPNNGEESLQFDPDKELDKYLLGSSQNNSRAEIQAEQEKEDVSMLLELFNPPAVSSKTDIVLYWEREKENNDILYELAMIVFAIPPTEVQIERDFSKLSFVFSDLRCKLTEERLEDIMIANLNSDLFYEVKKEQLMEHNTKEKEL